MEYLIADTDMSDIVRTSGAFLVEAMPSHLSGVIRTLVSSLSVFFDDHAGWKWPQRIFAFPSLAPLQMTEKSVE